MVVPLVYLSMAECVGHSIIGGVINCQVKCNYRIAAMSGNDCVYRTNRSVASKGTSIAEGIMAVCIAVAPCICIAGFLSVNRIVGVINVEIENDYTVAPYRIGEDPRKSIALGENLSVVVVVVASSGFNVGLIAIVDGKVKNHNRVAT